MSSGFDLAALIRRTEFAENDHLRVWDHNILERVFSEKLFEIGLAAGGEAQKNNISIALVFLDQLVQQSDLLHTILAVNEPQIKNDHLTAQCGHIYLTAIHRKRGKCRL